MKNSNNDDFKLIQRLSKQLKKPISILDLETTGLLCDPIVGIVEMAILTINENEIQSFSSLINPGITIPYSASRVHGIYDRDVVNQACFDNYIQHIQTILSEHVISGFNSKSFDLKVIQHNVERYQSSFCEPMHHLDVRQLWIRHSGSQSGKLSQLADIYKVEIGEQHRAMGDVLTTARLLEEMIWQHGVNFVIDNISGLNERSKPIINNKLKASQYSPTTVFTEPKKGVTDKPTTNEKIVKEKPISKAQIIRQETINHLQYFERLLRKNYSFIANRSDVSVSSVELEISKMYLSGQLPLEKVQNPTEQKLIEAHLDAAIATAGALKPIKPIKIALDRLTQTDIDYVQLYIAIENKFGKLYSK